MGRLVYLPTWMVHFYGFHVAKYTSPMDPLGIMSFIKNKNTEYEMIQLDEHILQQKIAETQKGKVY